METYQELLQFRIEMLRSWKKLLQKENKECPQLKKINFNMFKQNCRDRKHDAIAGHTKCNKTGLYFWKR